MFIRRKKNKSGVISIQVIDKSGGKYKLAKTMGSSADAFVIKNLEAEAQLWIRRHNRSIEFDFAGSDLQLEQLISSIQQISIAGIELLLGKLFTEIGFGAIKDELFKKLVLARLCYPFSKLKTVDYLRRYEHFETSELPFTGTWIS